MLKESWTKKWAVHDKIDIRKMFALLYLIIDCILERWDIKSPSHRVNFSSVCVEFLYLQGTTKVKGSCQLVK